MFGKLPLLAAAGLFVVGIVGFLAVGQPTPNWAVAPIISPTHSGQVARVIGSGAAPTETATDAPQTPLTFPPETTYATASPTPTQAAVIAASEGGLVPLDPLTDTPTPTASPTPSPTATATATPDALETIANWWLSMLTPTPTQVDSSHWDIPPDKFTQPSVEPTPSATVSGSATPANDDTVAPSGTPDVSATATSPGAGHTPPAWTPSHGNRTAAPNATANGSSDKQ